MAISRVPGFSLLANLDRQGTDIGITSSGLYVTYWDVVNYRFGINTATPQETLDVNGNILVANGHVYSGANIQFDIGSNTNWWRTVYANTINSDSVSGTLTTTSQPNITSLGVITDLNTTGNTYLVGDVTVNGNLFIGNIQTDISGNVSGNITGYVLQGDQPFITNLSNITVSNITITGGQFDFGGDVSFDYVNSNVIYQNNNPVLDSSSNIQITGDVIGYGTYDSINLQLAVTGVSEGTYGSAGQVAQFFVNNEGRVLSAANVTIGQIANLQFSNTTISSSSDLTISTATNGNIYLDAGSTGIVQISGTDAVLLPSGNNSERPANPQVGYFRYNTERGVIEYWDGTEWDAPGAALISSETIEPDGVSNVYTLGSNVTVDGIFVSINGTLQQPTYSYNIVNNNQIQFTEVPLTTDSVEVRLVSAAATTVSGLTFGTSTSVILDEQGVNVTGNLILSGFIANEAANVLLPNTATTTIDTYSISSYRTSKYVIQAVRASDVESYETLVTHNGTTAASTTYGVLTLGNSLGNVSATIVGPNVEIQYTATLANTYLTVSRNFYPT